MSSPISSSSTTRQHSDSSQESAVGLAFSYRLGTTTVSPLIFLIHGRAGNRDVMWLFERALPRDATIVSFQAPDKEPVPSLGGFSWWDIQVPGAARSEGLNAANLIAGALHRFESLFSLVPSHRIGIGFSQGAAVLSSLLQRNVVSCDGIALLAGFVIEESDTPPLNSTDKLHLPPVYIGHGTLDEVIPLERAIQGKDFLESRGYSVSFLTDPVGHKVGVGATRGLTSWIQTTLAAP